MLTILFVAMFSSILNFSSLFGGRPATGSPSVAERSVLDFTMTSIDGKQVPLAEYRGKVLLLVNVASKCGYTKQYAGLEKLYDTYRAQGFEILGFPANDFMGQEPGTDAEIKEFCTTKFGVSFPMFSKISVKGVDQHPLYRFLTSDATNPKFAGNVKWNFQKYLVGRDGEIIAKFAPADDPLSTDVVAAVEAALREKQPSSVK
jgi:glutathione peroxidase